MEIEHVHATYNDIHNLIKVSADKLAAFKPNLFVAIGLYFSTVMHNNATDTVAQEEGRS